jgi:hypothetical protein
MNNKDFELQSRYADQDGDYINFLTNKDETEIKIQAFSNTLITIYKKDLNKFRKALDMLEDMYK